MLPPLVRGGIVTSIESVAGATPSTPAKGARGSVMSSLKRTSVAPGSMGKPRIHGSVNSSARKPKPGRMVAQPHPDTSTSWMVTARTSPGLAPST